MPRAKWIAALFSASRMTALGPGPWEFVWAKNEKKEKLAEVREGGAKKSKEKEL